MMIAGLSHNAQWVLLGTLILGTAAGIIGCFAYWKRQSLMSDALSHASLPGVIIGFALVGSKNLPVMLAGAAAGALLGAMLIHWIRSSSRIKEDAAMGIVLSVFFGFGIMLLTMVNRMAGAAQSGLDSFIFGQAASMVQRDVWLMSGLALLVLIVAIVAFKEWKLFLFDSAFAKGLGLSGRLMNALYLFCLVLVIVVGIQAVGVILMAALLITPAVSARYWTDSFGRMVILSAVFGGVSGASGTVFSAYGSGWPTGPFIVLSAAALFVVSLAFGTRKGVVVQAVQQRRLRKELTKPKAERRTAEGGNAV